MLNYSNVNNKTFELSKNANFNCAILLPVTQTSIMELTTDLVQLKNALHIILNYKEQAHSYKFLYKTWWWIQMFRSLKIPKTYTHSFILFTWNNFTFLMHKTITGILQESVQTCIVIYNLYLNSLKFIAKSFHENKISSSHSKTFT